MRRRRAEARKRRRRRLMLGDAVIGGILALLLLLFGPGLALIAIGAGAVLLACLASIPIERAIRDSDRREADYRE